MYKFLNFICTHWSHFFFHCLLQFFYNTCESLIYKCWDINIIRKNHNRWYSMLFYAFTRFHTWLTSWLWSSTIKLISFGSLNQYNWISLVMTPLSPKPFSMKVVLNLYVLCTIWVLFGTHIIWSLHKIDGRCIFLLFISSHAMHIYVRNHEYMLQTMRTLSGLGQVAIFTIIDRKLIRYLVGSWFNICHKQQTLISIENWWLCMCHYKHEEI